MKKRDEVLITGAGLKSKMSFSESSSTTQGSPFSGVMMVIV